MIRKAKAEDLMSVAQIYEDILTEEEAGRAQIGWIRDVYPTADTAREAFERGELFVDEENGSVVAAGKINGEQMPAYAQVDWEYPAGENEVMVLHTLVVSPAKAGEGIGTRFVKFYENYALEHGCPYLRIDTNEKNVTARRMYKKLGYKERGIIPCVFNGIEGVHLVCLEKKV